MRANVRTYLSCLSREQAVITKTKILVIVAIRIRDPVRVEHDPGAALEAGPGPDLLGEFGHIQWEGRVICIRRRRATAG